jgi:hypothetical protein
VKKENDIQNRVMTKISQKDIQKAKKDSKEKLKNAQIFFSLIEVIVFVSFAQKIFFKILFEEDVIKFHVNSIRFRSITQKRKKQ